jgi:hypothetical protein
MKIYDYETFEENYKNIKSIKLKKWVDVTNKEYYSMYYGFWGKPLAVKFSQKNLGFFYFVNDKGSHAFRISKQKFKDTVEYVEISSELEIE